MPNIDPADLADLDERIIRRLRPFIDAAIDDQPETTRGALRRHFDEHGGLWLNVERLGVEAHWYVVASVAGHRLAGRCPCGAVFTLPALHGTVDVAPVRHGDGCPAPDADRLLRRWEKRRKAKP